MGFDPQWFIYYPLEYRVYSFFKALYLYLIAKVLEGVPYDEEARQPSNYMHLLNDLRRCLASCYDPKRSIFDLSNTQKHL